MRTISYMKSKQTRTYPLKMTDCNKKPRCSEVCCWYFISCVRHVKTAKINVMRQQVHSIHLRIMLWADYLHCVCQHTIYQCPRRCRNSSTSFYWTLFTTSSSSMWWFPRPLTRPTTLNLIARYNKQESACRVHWTQYKCLTMRESARCNTVASKHGVSLHEDLLHSDELTTRECNRHLDWINENDEKTLSQIHCRFPYIHDEPSTEKRTKSSWALFETTMKAS